MVTLSHKMRNARDNYSEMPLSPVRLTKPQKLTALNTESCLCTASGIIKPVQLLWTSTSTTSADSTYLDNKYMCHLTQMDLEMDLILQIYFHSKL